MPQKVRTAAVQESAPAKWCFSQVHWFTPQGSQILPSWNVVNLLSLRVRWKLLHFLMQAFLLLLIGVSIFGNTGEASNGSLPGRNNLVLTKEPYVQKIMKERLQWHF